jgi:hypothetical protein
MISLNMDRTKDVKYRIKHQPHSGVKLSEIDTGFSLILV